MNVGIRLLQRANRNNGICVHENLYRRVASKAEMRKLRSCNKIGQMEHRNAHHGDTEARRNQGCSALAPAGIRARLLAVPNQRRGSWALAPANLAHRIPERAISRGLGIDAPTGLLFPAQFRKTYGKAPQAMKVILATLCLMPTFTLAWAQPP